MLLFLVLKIDLQRSFPSLQDDPHRGHQPCVRRLVPVLLRLRGVAEAGLRRDDQVLPGPVRQHKGRRTPGRCVGSDIALSVDALPGTKTPSRLFSSAGKIVNCDIMYHSDLCSLYFNRVLFASSLAVVSCGALPTPPHGRKSTFNFLSGAEVKFDCDPGYVLLGEQRRWCYASGDWNWPEDGEATCVSEYLLEWVARMAACLIGCLEWLSSRRRDCLCPLFLIMFVRCFSLSERELCTGVCDIDI